MILNIAEALKISPADLFERDCSKSNKKLKLKFILKQHTLFFTLYAL